LLLLRQQLLQQLPLGLLEQPLTLQAFLALR
jgi:hypothetical protein